ncbi:MAG: hypothetical protein IIA27_05245, partial [Gemmatimonadetes bacterium]|nr:hypothetical protein [Gemmatimonadota bacterium]
MSKHRPAASEWRDQLAAGGLKAALEWRDGPFQDYRGKYDTAPRQRAPAGEEGGARMMVDQGVLKNPDVDAIFGLHITQGWAVGEVGF